MSLFINKATLRATGIHDSIAAGSGGATYVDVRGAFAGHGINSATHEPWINLDLTHPTSPDNFHPNAEGYEAYFASLNKVNAYSAP
jgi:lysophospholipase L1-like esterase